MKRRDDQPISLALSGGGTRAMAYHLGVLKWMAERNLLERVTCISTVSGGSLLVGFIYRSNDFAWPTSRHFLEKTLPEIGELLCARSLQDGALGQLVWLPNFRFILSRANLLALELEERWGFDVPLSHIKSGPEWSINGTNAQNGKRFRFKGSEIGDHNVGYAVAPDFPLAKALAVSAAFPIGIGPLTINTADFVWKKRPYWGAPESAAEVVKLPYKEFQLYDGGLYDNLGTESLFDLGKLESRHKGDFIVVSDAGAPFTYGTAWGPLDLRRIKRFLDVMSDQTRALRVRSLVAYLKKDPSNGAFFPIGTPINGRDCPDARYATTFPTSLDRFSKDDFQRLCSYGYSVAAHVDQQYGSFPPTLISQAPASANP
jgi:NTE family protein